MMDDNTEAAWTADEGAVAAQMNSEHQDWDDMKRQGMSSPESSQGSLDFLEENSNPQMILKELQQMAGRLTELEFQYVTLQEKAEQAKKTYDEFRCITLPNAFRLAGVLGIETTEGARVSIERKYYCSPNKNEADQDIMCNWLETVGGDDLIKRQAIVAAEKIPQLVEAGIPHAQKRDVNTNSLKAWLKREVGESGVARIKLEDVPPCMHFICLDEAQVKI